jgi:hypothetical protein
MGELMDAPRIITRYWAKPIPLRQFEWEASVDGGDERMVGCGRTEADAIEDLRRLLEEQADWQKWEEFKRRESRR